MARARGRTSGSNPAGGRTARGCGVGTTTAALGNGDGDLGATLEA